MRAARSRRLAGRERIVQRHARTLCQALLEEGQELLRRVGLLYDGVVRGRRALRAIHALAPRRRHAPANSTLSPRSRKTKFSIQTAVLPELTREQVVVKLAAHGYDGVEWRVHEDYHIAPRELVSRAGEIQRLVADHGLEVSCLMGYAPLEDLAQQRLFAEACAILGCRHYRPGAVIYDGTRRYQDLYQATVDALGKLLDAIAGFGAMPLIETHFGTIASSASLTHRLVQHFDPGRIGVNYDPANLIIEGREAWQMGLELLGPYLAYVHAKNIAWVREDGTWRWVFASMRDGQVDWAELMRLLAKVGYDGYIAFENFHRVPMRSKGYVGEDLTQHAEVFRDIDERLEQDLRYLKSLGGHA